jgi:hypothetical protein
LPEYTKSLNPQAHLLSKYSLIISRLIANDK